MKARVAPILSPHCTIEPLSHFRLWGVQQTTALALLSRCESRPAYLVELISSVTSFEPLFTTAKSGCWWELKSATARERGPAPTGNSPASMKDTGEKTGAPGTSTLTRMET